MDLLKITSKQDIIDCVDMYVSKDQWIPVSKQESLTNLYTAWKTDKFIRVVKDNGEIIGWLFATITKLPHQAFLSYSQYNLATLSHPNIYTSVEQQIPKHHVLKHQVKFLYFLEIH